MTIKKAPLNIDETNTAIGRNMVSPQDRNWYLIDADGQILGRMAVKIANILSGKNKSGFTRHIDTGDHVVVINSAKVRFTGNKLKNKVYRTFSLYPGGHHDRTLERVMKEDSTYPIIEAVKGMLPKNSLGYHMLKKLNVYTDAVHPHKAQKLKELK